MNKKDFFGYAYLVEVDGQKYIVMMSYLDQFVALFKKQLPVVVSAFKKYKVSFEYYQWYKKL